MPDPGRTALYRLFDADRHLLYVGIATSPTVRWSQHAGLSPWWGAVDSKEVEWLPSRRAAEAAEVEAIATEGPLWNKSSGVTSRERSADPEGPIASLKPALRRYDRAERAFIAARTALETEVVREFKNGASADFLSRHVPWGKAAILAMAKSAGVPKLRRPTVGTGTRWDPRT